ncbi:MAG: MFS transporter [Actinobacteria bacterium]|nr:MFS transporter [Actinomycetota bacterium]
MKARGPLVAYAGFGVFWGAWGVVLPDVKEQVGASVSELGIALFFISLAALPAMLLTGRLTDRIGARAVAPLLLLFAATVTLPGLTHSVTTLALALAALGLASGSLDVAINVAASTVEANGGRRVMQLAHALFSAGFLVAAVSVGLAREAGARPEQVLLVAAAVVAAAAVFNRGHPRASAPRRGRRLVFSGRLVTLGLLCAVAFVVESGIESWSALFLEEDLGAPPSISGLGPGLFAVAMVTGRLAGHALELRLGDRALFAGGAMTAALGLGLAASAPTIPLALAGFLVGGAGISVAAPTLIGAAGRGAGDAERGSAVASVTTLSYLGFLGGPPLIGAVSGAYDLRVGFALLAAIAAALALTAASFGGALSLRRGQHPARGGVR